MIFRLVPTVLALAALVLPLPTTAQDSSSRPGGLSELQRQEIEALIGQYIRNHPEVILESVRNMQNREQADQQRRQQEALASRRDEIERDPASPVAGNSAGDVTLVEFFDYRCGYCKSVFPAVQRLLKDDSKVRYVLKELPILSPESRIAARLALAVWRVEPKRYFALHAKLMEARGDLTQARIFELARDAGVDVERARREMDNPEIERTLAQNMELANALGINGTPGFIVGEKLIPGAIDIETLKKLVEEARRNG
jgi:protein-disulfide isomerase